jgi:hypothetical protein
MKLARRVVEQAVATQTLVGAVVAHRLGAWGPQGQGVRGRQNDGKDGR